MNLKYTLGLYLPLTIIGILVVLSMTEVGFSVETENKIVYKDDVFIQSDYKYPYPNNGVVIQTLTIKNDFFLPRRYELPSKVACTTDRNKMTLTLTYDYDGRIDYDYIKNTQSVEVPMYSSKKVNLILQPQYVYDNRTYDKLILIETPDQYNYNYCQKPDLTGTEILLS